ASSVEVRAYERALAEEQRYAVREILRGLIDFDRGDADVAVAAEQRIADAGRRPEENLAELAVARADDRVTKVAVRRVVAGEGRRAGPGRERRPRTVRADRRRVEDFVDAAVARRDHDVPRLVIRRVEPADADDAREVRERWPRQMHADRRVIEDLVH